MYEKGHESQIKEQDKHEDLDPLGWPIKIFSFLSLVTVRANAGDFLPQSLRPFPF